MLLNQLKLSEHLSKREKILKKINSSSSAKSIIDLPLSTELIHAIRSNVHCEEDEFGNKGYLPANIGSNFTLPLDSMSLFSPDAAKLGSKFTSSNFQPMNGSYTLTATSNFKIGESIQPPSINDAKSRLEILWLRRKADVARNAQKYDEGINLLEEALDLHLGSKDYHSADLSLQVLSSDPRELLNSVQHDFIIYDASIHQFASRIQRSYRKRFNQKCEFATIVSKIFRGYLARRKVFFMKMLWIQCALKIQRAFRKHLRRMHTLATLLKNWFKVRKAVKAYQKRLHLYKMARRIQKLYRGMAARMKVQLLRQKLAMVKKCQRNSRGYILRRDRCIGLILYHKMFFYAARNIQCKIRKIQAMERSQFRLLVELAMENIRYHNEQVVIEELLNISRIKNRHYCLSWPGQYHREYVFQKYLAKRFCNKFNKPVAPDGVNESSIDIDDQTKALILEILEQYDEVGNGYISVKKLKQLIKEVGAVPPTDQSIDELTLQLDVKRTGTFGIVHFMNWYISESADDWIEPATMTNRMVLTNHRFSKSINRLSDVGIQTRLSYSNQVHDVRSHMNASNASPQWRTRVLFKSYSPLIAKHATINFRKQHPPKYQCCQCLKPFVMFTDFFAHFDSSNGHCKVLNLKAIFLSKYWMKSEWSQQRQIEKEIIRVNDEHQYIEHHSTIKIIEDRMIQKSKALSPSLKNQCQLQYHKYYETFQNVSNQYIVKTMVDEIMKTIQINGQHQSANNFVMDILTQIFPCVPYHKECLLENIYELSQLRPWLLHYFQSSQYGEGNESEKKRNKSDIPLFHEDDEDDVPDNNTLSRKSTNRMVPKQTSSSVKTSKSIKMAASTKDTQLLSSSFNSNKKVGVKPTIDFKENAVKLNLPFAKPKRLFSMTSNGRKRKICWNLALFYVHILRFYEVETTAHIQFLLEYRGMRPRRIKLHDKLLQSMELQSLTSTFYNSKFEILQRRLKRLHTCYSDLLNSDYPMHTSGCMSRWLKGSPYKSILNSLPINSYWRDDCHQRAKVLSAMQWSVIRSHRHPFRRLEDEWWVLRNALHVNAAKQIYVRQSFNPQTNGSSYLDSISSPEIINQIELLLEAAWMFEKYSVSAMLEGIDCEDLLLLITCESVPIPHSEEIFSALQNVLDSVSKGIITKPVWMKWMTESNFIHMNYQSNLFKKGWGLGSDGLYKEAAMINALIRIRKKYRIQLTIREMIMHPSFDVHLFLRTNQLQRAVNDDPIAFMHTLEEFIQSNQTLPIKQPSKSLIQNPAEFDGMTIPEQRNSLIFEEENIVVQSNNEVIPFQEDILEPEGVDSRILTENNQTAASIPITMTACKEWLRLNTLDSFQQNLENGTIIKEIEDNVAAAYAQRLKEDDLAKYNIFLESQLLKATDDMIEAISCCIPSHVHIAQKDNHQQYKAKGFMWYFISGGFGSSKAVEKISRWYSNRISKRNNWDKVISQNSQSVQSNTNIGRSAKVFVENEVNSYGNYESLEIDTSPGNGNGNGHFEVSQHKLPLTYGQTHYDQKLLSMISLPDMTWENRLETNIMEDDINQSNMIARDPQQYSTNLMGMKGSLIYRDARLGEVGRVNDEEDDDDNNELNDKLVVFATPSRKDLSKLFQSIEPNENLSSKNNEFQNIPRETAPNYPHRHGNGVQKADFDLLFQGYEVLLTTLISVFDTNSSGELSEGDIQNLFNCLNCAHTERSILQIFQEMRILHVNDEDNHYESLNQNRYNGFSANSSISNGKDDLQSILKTSTDLLKGDIQSIVASSVQDQAMTKHEKSDSIPTISMRDYRLLLVLLRNFEWKFQSDATSNCTLGGTSIKAFGFKSTRSSLISSINLQFFPNYLMFRNLKLSAKILLNEKHQFSRKHATKMMQFSRDGDFIPFSHTSNIQSLIVRTQLLAMRQQNIFLDTTHGQIHIMKTTHALGKLWFSKVLSMFDKAVPKSEGLDTIDNNNVTPFSVIDLLGVDEYGNPTLQPDDKVDPVIHNNSPDWFENEIKLRLLRYAYSIHCGDSRKGLMLVTELPFFVQYIVGTLSLNFFLGPSIRNLLETLKHAQNNSSISWMSFDQLLDRLIQAGFVIDRNHPFIQHNADDIKLFVGKSQRWRWVMKYKDKNFQRDAKLRQQSLGRQQALAISMNLEDVDITETNYRCGILGIHRCIQMNRNKQRSQKSIYRFMIPKESAVLFLLSKGYPIDTVAKSCQDVLGSCFIGGAIQTELIDIGELEKKLETFCKSNLLSTFMRTCRKLFSHRKHSDEFHNFCSCLKFEAILINQIGGDFLKELITGVSICVHHS